MSVIGRLDEQVESILIRPLDSDRRAAARERHDSSDEPKRSSNDGEKALDETDDLQEKHSRREELPVWLL